MLYNLDDLSAIIVDTTDKDKMKSAIHIQAIDILKNDLKVHEIKVQSALVDFISKQKENEFYSFDLLFDRQILRERLQNSFGKCFFCLFLQFLSISTLVLGDHANLLTKHDL